MIATAAIGAAEGTNDQVAQSIADKIAKDVIVLDLGDLVQAGILTVDRKGGGGEFGTGEFGSMQFGGNPETVKYSKGPNWAE